MWVIFLGGRIGTLHTVDPQAVFFVQNVYRVNTMLFLDLIHRIA